MRLWIALLFSVVASAQTAVWPGSAATDSQLLVGANLCQTRLSQPINDTTSTTIFVTNSSVTSPYCFVVNQEVQVDNEFMKVTSVAFGQMTVTRGFDYSTASTHQINAPVVNNVAAAWYHNALAKEIESIEAWLAAGGGGGGGGGVCGTNGSIQYNNSGVCGGYAILPAAVLPAATDSAQGAVELPTGGTSNQLGTVASQVQQTMSISVKQAPYNAAGDGSANDTTPIASACSDARSSGAILYFPHGTYLTDPITCITNSGMILEGDGPNQTFLKSRTGGSVISGTGLTIHAVTIRDLSINGNNGTGDAISLIAGDSMHFVFQIFIRNVIINNTQGRCVYMPDGYNITIDGSECSSTGANGWEINGGPDSVISNSYVHSVGANSAGYRIYAGLTQLTNDNGLDTAGTGVNATWGRFGQNTLDGDSTNSYAFVTMTNCNVEDFTKYGVWVSNGVATFQGVGWLAYLGSTTEAIHYDSNYTGNAMSSVIDSNSTMTTLGAWTGGYAIHTANTSCPLIINYSPTGTVNTTQSCYDDLDMLLYNSPTITRKVVGFGLIAADWSFFSSSNAYLTAPHLGTPHDAVLTNATGLPLSGHTAQAADTVVMNQTGGSAAPTAIGMPTGGTNGCAGGTNALIYNTTTHQLGCNTLNPYGAFSGWGAVSLDFGGTATQYSPYIGGAATNGTETVVSLAASSTATLSHLSVTLSAQLGASATLAVTLEDGTATPTALTCTTASGGTTCTDNSHSVNVTQGDLLSFKLVSGGSVSAGVQEITISYTIGVTSATIIQGGVASLTAPVVTSGSTENTIISAPVAANSVSAGTVYRINAVCTATSGAGSGANELFVHYGTTGTSSDTILGALSGTSPTTGTGIGFLATIYVTFTSTTATTLSGGYTNSASNTGAWPIFANYGFVGNTTSLNTTANKFLTLTAQSVGGTTVFTCNPGTSIEVVKP